jgi:hypothetical protein
MPFGMPIGMPFGMPMGAGVIWYALGMPPAQRFCMRERAVPGIPSRLLRDGEAYQGRLARFLTTFRRIQRIPASGGLPLHGSLLSTRLTHRPVPLFVWGLGGCRAAVQPLAQSIGKMLTSLFFHFPRDTTRGLCSDRNKKALEVTVCL